jgi:hypothetical protein
MLLSAGENSTELRRANLLKPKALSGGRGDAKIKKSLGDANTKLFANSICYARSTQTARKAISIHTVTLQVKAFYLVTISPRFRFEHGCRATMVNSYLGPAFLRSANWLQTTLCTTRVLDGRW